MKKPPLSGAGFCRRFFILGAGIRSLMLLLIIVVGSSAALAQQTILFNGHEASSDRLIAKIKTESKVRSAKAQRDQAAKAVAASPEISAARVFSSVPGLVALDLSEQLAPASPPLARGAQKPAPLERTAQVKALIESLMATGLYEYVEPDYFVTANNVPTDQAYNDGTLWGLKNTGQRGGVSGADIRAEEAWATTVGSPDVIVAVIDTGIDYNHPDLQANMWRNPGETPGNGIDDDGNGFIDDVHGINAITMSGDPMDDNDHGTHCAGTIAAQANAGGPHVGVAWNARLMALKFLSASGGGSISGAITCVDYATAMGAHISNNSWSGSGYSQGLFDAITANRDAGSLFVAAASNDYSNNDIYPMYPASYQVDNIIAVAAMNRFDNKADFSNYGARSVHIGAPGADIYSSLAGGGYAEFDGTSMASPHVAGVAALVWSAFPQWQQLTRENMTAIRNQILGTVRPVPAMSGLVATGGMVDAAAAVGGGNAPPTIVASLSTRPAPLPAGVQADAFIRLTRQGAALPGATVTAVIDSETFNFADNGQLPDEISGDGVYSALIGPYTSGTYPVDITIVFEGETYPRNLVLSVEEPGPANDNFEDATPTGNDTRFTASSLRATAQQGEPSWRDGGSGTAYKTLWWAWSPSVTGSATITTFDSRFDTTLAVFTGSSLQSLTYIVGNDDASGGGLQSSVTFPAEVGTTYFIQVDGWSGASGDVVLNVPAGDLVDSPPVFVRNPVSQAVSQGEDAIFTAEASGNPAPAYQWFFNGAAIINIPGRVEGATTGQLTIRSVVATDSGGYYCRATNTQGSADSSSASLVVETGVRPANDNLENAQPLQDGVPVTGASDQATREAGEPEHANVSGDKSVWYTWTSTEEGTVTVDTSGSSYDTTLAVYIGDTLQTLRTVASNDDNGSSVQSLVTFPTKANVTYRIAVDGSGRGVSGFVNLLLSFASGGNEIIVPAPDTPIPITDLTTIESYIDISGQPLSLPVGSVLLDLNITHSYRGDLVVRLTSPGGTVFTISDRQGRSAPNIIISAQALDSFTGNTAAEITPNGRWTLQVQDAAAGDEGTLNGWALRFPGGGPGDGDDEEFFPPEVGQPIEDLQPTTVTLDVSGLPDEMPVGNVRLNLVIRHTYRGDLRVELIAPGDRSAPTYLISDREGGSQQDVVVNNQPLDSPAFRVVPQDVQTINPNGTWTLLILDSVRGDVGTLESWSLVFSGRSGNPPDDTSPPVVDSGEYHGVLGAFDFGVGGPSDRQRFEDGHAHVSVKITRGRLTGRLLYRGRSNALRGSMSDGLASARLRDKSIVSVNLRAVFSDSGAVIPGHLAADLLDDSGNTLSTGTLSQAADVGFESSQRFNVLFRNFGPANPPLTGDGFAMAKLGRKHTLRIKGVAPNGIKFTGAGQFVGTPDPTGSDQFLLGAMVSGGIAVGRVDVDSNPATGLPHLDGTVGYVDQNLLIDCYTQGTTWNPVKGTPLVDRYDLFIGFSPPESGPFMARLWWEPVNKPMLEYGGMTPVKVSSSTGLFRGALPVAGDKPQRFQGLLLGKPIRDFNVVLYGGGYLLSPFGSSLVEIIYPD